MARTTAVDKLIRDLEELAQTSGNPRDTALWQAGVYARKVLKRRPRKWFTQEDFEEAMQDVYTYVLANWHNYKRSKYDPGTWGALRARTALKHSAEAKEAAKRTPLPWDVTEDDIRRLAENNGWAFQPGCWVTGMPADPYDKDPNDE
jgi:hypothetical protein